MNKATPLSLDEAFGTLIFAGNRTPESTDIAQAFCELSTYREGGIFLGHYAGYSEWERHPVGDEVVMVLEGETTLVLLLNGTEVPNLLLPQQLIVVPANTWHRFESPKGVKVMTVTPQPTDHSTEFPS